MCEFTIAMASVLHDQGQHNDFLRCRVRGGHGPHDLLAMGEEKLTANMGAESIMDTVTGEQRVQPVRKYWTNRFRLVASVK